MKKLSLGSISHGTLRPEDLASAIRNTLLSLEHKESDSIIQELAAIAENEGRDTEFDSEVISDAIDILNDYAPAFCYVGMHEGDGSDLGVWPDLHQIETAVSDGDAIKIGDLSDLDSLAVSELQGANYAILVNDHGNMTIYELSIAATQIWDCV